MPPSYEWLELARAVAGVYWPSLLGLAILALLPDAPTVGRRYRPRPLFATVPLALWGLCFAHAMLEDAWFDWRHPYLHWHEGFVALIALAVVGLLSGVAELCRAQRSPPLSPASPPPLLASLVIAPPLFVWATLAHLQGTDEMGFARHVLLVEGAPYWPCLLALLLTALLPLPLRAPTSARLRPPPALVSTLPLLTWAWCSVVAAWSEFCALGLSREEVPWANWRPFLASLAVLTLVSLASAGLTTLRDALSGRRHVAPAFHWRVGVVVPPVAIWMLLLGSVSPHAWH